LTERIWEERQNGKGKDLGNDKPLTNRSVLMAAMQMWMQAHLAGFVSAPMGVDQVRPPEQRLIA